MKKGITLIELLVTVMIISIVVMVALPSFHRMQESSLNREAWGSLKRMQEAVRLYNMEFSQYYPTAGTISNISNINQNLRLSLPTTGTPNWNYAMKYEAAGTCVQATRNGDDARIWSLEISDNADDLDQNPDSYDEACP